ncbi:hypothetical protein TELCIR_15769, partial [Teladorsagia circumcincta]
TAPTTTTPSLGLGGTTQTSGFGTTPGIGATTAGTTAEKENLRDGIVPKPIREVAIQLREKLKENRKLAEEFTANSSDMTIKVKEQIKEDAKSVMTADGSLYIQRETIGRKADGSLSFNKLRGNDFVPSQSSIAELGKQLKPAAATAAPSGTGTGLFGSTTGGSLFGSSSTAAKPFSFASTSTGGTSLFPSLTTSSAGPLFSSLTSTSTTAPKPTLSFGSTITNNSSGLLFSSKK